jgi:hypothetical protein
MNLVLSALALLALAAGGNPATGRAADDATAALRDGVALLEAGDLDQAAQRLEQAVEKLGSDPKRGHELATAHLYLAMAQLGRGQAERARVHLREAWIRRQGAKLDPGTFPPRVISLYEEVGAEVKPRRTSGKIVAGVGVAAAGAGVLVGRASSGSTPAPIAEAPKPRTVRLFNIDDTARVSVNGQVLAEVGLGQDSGLVDISARLGSGANEVVFELINSHGAISYGFEVRVGEAIVFQETCGLAMRFGCEDDRRFPPGVARRFVYTVTGR